MRKLIAANWKMHGHAEWINKPAEFDKLYPYNERQNLEILICPPFTLISEMRDITRQNNISLGAQNCHEEARGAYTGEISPEMLAHAGAQYVILGHSERRAMGESNADIMRKAKAARRPSLIPIICVGESLEIRELGEATEFVLEQIKNSVPEHIGDYVLAYEPIWAIGTGRVPQIEDIEQMHGRIRELVGPDVRVLYGGSVKPANAEEILSVENVDGVLIGGASLEMDSLMAIAKAAA